MQVHWLRSPVELQQLGPVYWRFLSSIGDHAYLYELDRVRTLFPIYRPLSGEFAWLWVESDGEMIGLAPLQLQTKNIWRGGLRVLRAYGRGLGTLSQWYSDWLALPGREREVLNSIRDALLATFASQWDMLEVVSFQVDDPVTSQLREVWPEADWIPNSITALHANLSEYARGFPPGFNSRSRRKFDQAHRLLTSTWGEFKIEVTSSISASRWHLIEAMHRARQSILRGHGISRDDLFELPERASAFRALMNWGEQTSRARHYWLEIAGQLAAFNLGIQYGQTMYLLLIAMDDEFSKVSPSRLLMLAMARGEIERGTRIIDLGVGTNLLKEQFATHEAALVDFHCINSTRIGSRLRCAWLLGLRRMRKGVGRLMKKSH